MRLVLTATTWAAMTLARDLAAAGFRVSEADSADALFAHVLDGRPDAILIAGDLADVATENAVRALRGISPACPVVVIDDVADTLPLYLAGADAILPPSADVAEIAARLRAMVLRIAGFAQPVQRFGTLEVDLAGRVARVSGARVPLARLEFELLEALVLARGALLSRADLMDKLYGLEDAPCDRIISVYMSHIRRKIAAAGGPAEAFKNLPGRGYAFEPGDALPLPLVA